MDWPFRAETGRHFDKQFMDDYQHIEWDDLVERYGVASLVWLDAAVFYGYWRGGDR